MKWLWEGIRISIVWKVFVQLTPQIKTSNTELIISPNPLPGQVHLPRVSPCLPLSTYGHSPGKGLPSLFLELLPLAGLWGPPWPSLSLHFTPMLAVIAIKLAKLVSPPLRNAWLLPSSARISAANSCPLLGPERLGFCSLSQVPGTTLLTLRKLCSKTSSPQAHAFLSALPYCS